MIGHTGRVTTAARGYFQERASLAPASTHANQLSCPSQPSPAASLTPNPLPCTCACTASYACTQHTRTPHENRYYASWQGGTSAQSRRTHLGCMGVRGCEGSCAGHGRQAGQWLTCARPAAKRQIVRLLEEVVHSSAYSSTCNRAGWAVESPKQIVACDAVFVTSHVHMHMSTYTRTQMNAARTLALAPDVPRIAPPSPQTKLGPACAQPYQPSGFGTHTCLDTPHAKPPHF